ncbi:hypothetical protein GMRT_15979 [Giardia muris]|uniref:Uncharacterized protein n=1 Tax=Giardia muris TaxID=5742 RepID=A0A4Z1SU52_GIAMU|nr:hypothetical protein GMRT_15979 [Giardia muris]|eukprot:TNJ29406.1 hypothetical protein GMRT_15979 [Giardia muris]
MSPPDRRSTLECGDERAATSEELRMIGANIRDEIVSLYGSTRVVDESAHALELGLSDLESKHTKLEQLYQNLRGLNSELVDAIENVDPVFHRDQSALRRRTRSRPSSAHSARVRPSLVAADGRHPAVDEQNVTPNQIYTLLQSINGTNETVSSQMMEGLQSLKLNLAKVVEDNNVLNAELHKLHEETLQKDTIHAELVELLKRRDKELTEHREALRALEQRGFSHDPDPQRLTSSLLSAEKADQSTDMSTSFTNLALPRMSESAAENTRSLENEVLEYQQRMHAATEEVNLLKQQIVELTNTLEQVTAEKNHQLHHLAEELERIKEDVTQRRTSDAALTLELEQKVQESLAEKEELLRYIEGLGRTHAVAIAERDEQLVTLQQAFKELEEKSATEQAALEQKLQELNHLLQEKEETITLLTSERDQLLHDWEESAAALQAQVEKNANTAETEVIRSRLASTLAARERALKDAKTRIVELQNEIAELRNNQEHLQRDGEAGVLRLQAQLRNVCNRYATLQAQYDEEKRKHDPLQKETICVEVLSRSVNTEPEFAMAGVTGEEALSDRQQSDLTAILQSKNNELEMLRIELEECKSAVHLEPSIRPQDASERQIDVAGSQVRVLLELERYKERAAFYEERVAEHKTTLAQLTHDYQLELERLRKELAERGQDLKELTAERNEIQGKLHRLEVESTAKAQELQTRIELMDQMHSTLHADRSANIEALQSRLEQFKDSSDHSIDTYKQQVERLTEELTETNERYAKSVEKREKEIIRLKTELKEKTEAYARAIAAAQAEVADVRRRAEKDQRTINLVIDKQTAELQGIKIIHSRELASRDETIRKQQATIDRLRQKHAERISELKGTVAALVSRGSIDNSAFLAVQTPPTIRASTLGLGDLAAPSVGDPLRESTTVDELNATTGPDRPKTPEPTAMIAPLSSLENPTSTPGTMGALEYTL